MRYVSRAPAPPLDRFIDDIYCMTGVPRHRRLNVPPMPSAHLMINLGEPVGLYDSDAAAPPAMLTDGWFMGMWSRRFTIEHHAPVRVVGVHFKPWGLAPFVGMPMVELQDRSVQADAIWAGSVDRLRDRLDGAPTAGSLLQVMETELRSRLVPQLSSGFQLVDHVAGQLEDSWGSVRVSTLTEAAGVSGNQLTVQFRTHIGLTPKRVARVYRFARVILDVDTRYSVDWSQVAHSAGYFDQAHFGKEFKNFTGHTPTAYLALRRRCPAQIGFPPDNGPMPG
ncbi:helix-turn-helix domain-containing protein [Williamsia sterculiae]|uniref:Transcriptional regulator, AraC family n=1 Tax=Williamsia sterculiae TaxID=1344003 RepID=A0A1N7H0V7_9NOCA|nr:helix-turn-helix domain-containing protein [Williamsia sterculiae]SIS18474.1 transcriptional regulator, AraC family [Williamsia sterculiae]